MIASIPDTALTRDEWLIEQAKRDRPLTDDPIHLRTEMQAWTPNIVTMIDGYLAYAGLEQAA